MRKALGKIRTQSDWQRDEMNSESDELNLNRRIIALVKTVTQRGNWSKVRNDRARYRQVYYD